MKHIILLVHILAFLFSTETNAQQVLPYISRESNNPKEELTVNEDSTQRDSTFITVFGIGSAESLQLDKLTAAGAISANLTINKYTTATLSFNYGAVGVKKEQPDSVPLSLFYFPDLANIAFAGGVDIHAPAFGEQVKHQWSFSIESSIQRRNIERDSMVYQFGITNINAGPKYRWIYSRNSHTAIFTVGISYNYVGINRNNSDAFTTLFKDYQSPAAPPVQRYFHGFSFMTSLQLDNAILFARTYTDFNQSADLAFTVGIKAAAEFFSF